MKWGTFDDIKKIIEEGNKDFKFSYMSSDIDLKVYNLNDEVIKKNKFLQSRTGKASNNTYYVKIAGVTRCSHLKYKIIKFIEIYNTFCNDNEKITQSNINNYRIMCVFKFSNQDTNLKISDVVKRLTILNIKYEIDFNSVYIELRLFDQEVKISFFKKEDDEEPRSVFMFIDSYEINDYLHKLHTVANVVGAVMKTTTFLDPKNKFKVVLMI